ncbi:hypothetical protein [Nitrosopumilus sp. S6]
MAILERVEPKPKSSTKQTGSPTVIRWKGQKLIRSHSIRACAYEILQASKIDDVVKITLIGQTGTGKTTIQQTLSHLIHTMSDIPYAVKTFTKHDLLNIEETINTLKLSPTNYIIHFDDVSFLTESKKEIEKIKQIFTVMRHMIGEGTKIIAFFSFHYSKGLDKYLRMSNFTFHTSMGNEEIDNVQQTLRGKHNKIVEEFAEIFARSRNGSNKFTMPLGKKNFFSYKVKDPFTLSLFINGYSARYIVSPKREWIDPVCSICSTSHLKTESKPNIEMEDFVKDFSTKFTIGNAKTAVKIKLFQNGINVFSPRIIQAMKYLDRLIAEKTFNLEDLALAYDLEPQKAVLSKAKQPDIKESNVEAQAWN